MHPSVTIEQRQDIPYKSDSCSKGCHHNAHNELAGQMVQIGRQNHHDAENP